MKPTLDLLQACEQIQKGQLQADDYLEQCFSRADEIEPELKAFTVRAPLKDLQTESRPGPLKGIPVAIKDIIATKDLGLLTALLLDPIDEWQQANELNI